MTTSQRKFSGALTLGKLEIGLEAHEQLFGAVTALEVLGTYTIATYDDADFPAVSSLALMPCIGGEAPPAPAGAQLLFKGKVLVLNQAADVAAFRTA